VDIESATGESHGLLIKISRVFLDTELPVLIGGEEDGIPDVRLRILKKFDSGLLGIRHMDFERVQVLEIKMVPIDRFLFEMDQVF
jgi:hypothetical protein